MRNSRGCSARAQKLGISRIVSFGADEKSDARLLDLSLHATCSAVHADILGHDVTYKLGMPGRHMAMNSLAVLAAPRWRAPISRCAALSLSQLEPRPAAASRRTLRVASGEAR